MSIFEKKVQSKLDLLKKIEEQKQIVNNHVQSLQNSIRDKGEEIKCQLNQLYIDGELECEQMDAMEKLKKFTLDSKNLGIRYFQEDMSETQSNIDGLQSKFDTLASYKPQVICEKKTFEIVIEEAFYLKPHLEENYKNKRDIIWEKAKKGSLRTQLSAPNSLDIDKTNNFVYIADTKNCRVQIFTENGDHFSAILLPENFCPLKVRILRSEIYIYGNWNDKFYLASCHRNIGCVPDNNGFEYFQSVPEFVSFDVSEFAPHHVFTGNLRFLGYLANEYHVILDFPRPSRTPGQSLFSGATCRTGGLGGTTGGLGGTTGGFGGGTTGGFGGGTTGGLGGTTGGLGGTTSGLGGTTGGFGGTTSGLACTTGGFGGTSGLAGTTGGFGDGTVCFGAIPGGFGTRPKLLAGTTSGGATNTNTTGFTLSGTAGNTGGGSGLFGGTAGNTGGGSGLFSGTAGNTGGGSGLFSGTAGNTGGGSGHFSGTAGNTGGESGLFSGTAGNTGGGSGLFSGTAGNTGGGSGLFSGTAGNTGGGSGHFSGTAGNTGGGSGHFSGTAGNTGGESGLFSGTAGNTGGGSGLFSGTAGNTGGGSGLFSGTAGNTGGGSGHFSGTAGNTGGESGLFSGTAGNTGGESGLFSGTAGNTGGGSGPFSGTAGGTIGSGGATVGFGGGTGTSQGFSPFIPTTSTAIFPQPQFTVLSSTNQNYIYLKSIYLQDNTQALDLQSLQSHSHTTVIYVLYRYCQFAVLAFNSNGICLRGLVEMDTCKIPYAFSVDSQTNIVILSGKQKERSNKIKLDADEVKTSELLVYNKEDLLSSLTLHEDPDNIADICSDSMFDVVLIFSDGTEEGGMIRKY